MILLVGGTGYVGSRVCEILIRQQQEIRVLARGSSDWESSVIPRFKRSGVDVMVGDVRDRKVVDKALQGCKAVINCSGVIRAASPEELVEINVEGVENLVRLGEDRGVQRFIQLSCLGATEHSNCRYLQSKWQAENLVRKSRFYWTIFRPSLIFGPGSRLSRVLDFWVSRTPFLLVVGSGLNKLQPVSADQLASCMAQAVYNRETVGKSYDLVGSESLVLKELLAMTARSEGQGTFCLKIPCLLGVPLSGLLGRLNPKCPIDGEIMKVMTSDLVTDEIDAMQGVFKLEPLPYSSVFKQLKKTGEAKGAKRHEEDSDEDVDDEPPPTPARKKAPLRAGERKGKSSSISRGKKRRRDEELEEDEEEYPDEEKEEDVEEEEPPRRKTKRR